MQNAANKDGTSIASSLHITWQSYGVNNAALLRTPVHAVMRRLEL